MYLGEFIDLQITKQGRSKIWVAEQAKINYKTFVDKIKYDRFTAYDLIKVAKVLNIDLNELKELDLELKQPKLNPEKVEKVIEVIKNTNSELSKTLKRYDEEAKEKVYKMFEDEK